MAFTRSKIAEKQKMKKFIYTSTFVLIGIFIIWFSFFKNTEVKTKNNRTPVTITYWHYWTGFEGDALKYVVEKFNNEHKDIKVNLVTISEPWKKSLLSITGGRPPDLLNISSEWLPDLATRGALTSLDDYCKKYNIKENLFIPVYWKMLNYKNHIWGLPITPESCVIFWNKDHFKEVGLDPEKPPKNITDWKLYSDKLTIKNKNGEIIRAGFLPSWPSWANSVYPLLFNGSWGNSDGDILTANHPNNIKAWEWVQEFSRSLGAENIQSFEEEFGNYQGPNNPFYSGKISFQINGVWEANFISKFAPKLNYGAAVAYDNAGNPITSVISTDIVIPKGAKHSDEAFYFISWLMKQRNIEDLVIRQKKFSPLLSSCNEDFIKNHPNKYIKIFIDAARSEKASYFPPTTIFQIYKREMKRAFQEVSSLTKDPKTALDEVQIKLDEELKRQKKYEDLR